MSDKFQFWQITPWVIAAGSLTVNILQFRHNRRVKIRVKVRSENDQNAPHIRWLLVDVTNLGTELNDITAVIQFPQKDGKLTTSPLHPAGVVPNPFKYQFTCQFRASNDEPSKDIYLLSLPLHQVDLIIYSNSVPVKAIPAVKWKDALFAVGNANSSLPPKPAPPEQPMSWFQRQTGRRSW